MDVRIAWPSIAAAFVIGAGCSPAAERSAPAATRAPEVARPEADGAHDPAQFFPRSRARLLILGTFHFEDAGLDDYRPRHRVDILSSARQAELALLLDRLEAFAPTKIAIEYPKVRQLELDRAYGAYLDDPRPATANEIEQVGFQLARRLAHARLYAIDVRGRSYVGSTDPVRAARRWNQEHFLNAELDAQYRRYYEWSDELKTKTTLIDYLVFLNSPEALAVSHGAYVIGPIKVARGKRYPGADSVVGWWYSRNLRIFTNVAQLIDAPHDRVLLLIGAGHVPILRHAAEASPEIEVIDVAEVLSPDRPPG